jgi:hypothetical protein
MSHSQAEITQSTAQPIFELRKFLHAHHCLSIFIFRLKDFTLCRELYGDHVAEELENLLITALSNHESANPASPPRHALRVAAGEALLIRCPGQAGDSLLMDQAFSLKVSLQAALESTPSPRSGREFEIEVGFALLPESTIFERERVFHEVIGDARRMAQGGIDLEAVKLSSLFRSIIRNGQIRCSSSPSTISRRDGHGLGGPGPRPAGLGIRIPRDPLRLRRTVRTALRAGAGLPLQGHGNRGGPGDRGSACS